MIEEVAWVFLGILAGIATGLLPGIHSNTIAFMALYAPIGKSTGFALFVVSMSITNSFIDAIPSILLGAPSGESSINLLPGHEMLLQGRGLEAVQLATFGGLVTGVFAVLLAPFFFSLAKNYGEHLPTIIPALIIWTIFIMVKEERDKATAIALMLLAGATGIIVMGSSVNQAVFVLVIGFFGLPSLIESIFTNSKIPTQRKPEHGKVQASIGFASALVSGCLAILPGIGPAQATAIVKKLFGKMSKAQYLAITGGINTGNLFFSILMLYAIGKTRTGMAVALDSAIKLDYAMLLAMMAGATAAIGFAAAITPIIAEKAITIMQKINYRKTSAGAAIFLVALVAAFSGIWGVVACLSAASIAIGGIAGKVHRSHCMAFLLMPTLLFYLGIAN